MVVTGHWELVTPKLGGRSHEAAAEVDHMGDTSSYNSFILFTTRLKCTSVMLRNQVTLLAGESSLGLSPSVVLHMS